MTEDRSQSGYVLLLMLLVMMTGSATLMVPLASSGSSSASYPMNTALQDTRQSLLVYATLYPYLYGPRSAGPGHLPCPDTAGAEGPDPPCGRASQATGRLPRHVSLPGHRYAFQSAISHRYDYAVASDLINNPVNRVVNDEILRSIAVSDEPFIARVAVGVQAFEDSGYSGETLRVALSARSMIPGVKAVVAAWVVTRVNGSVGQRCADVLFAEAAASGGLHIELLTLIADEPSKATSTMSGDASGNTSQENSQGNQQDNPGYSLAECLANLEADQATEGLLLEGVPAASHWFVRNRWHERISLKNHQLPLTIRDIRFP